LRKHCVDILCPAIHHHDGSVFDPGMLQQVELNFCRLYPVTANLDLIIQPAEKLDIAARQESSAIAGEIGGSPFAGLQRVIDKTLVGFRVIADISRGNPGPGDTQLAANPDRSEAPPFVEDADSSARYRPPDRHSRRLAPVRRSESRRPYSGFGRAVFVNNLRVGNLTTVVTQQRGSERLAGGNHQSQ
jgi:hypothetical protein